MLVRSWNDPGPLSRANNQHCVKRWREVTSERRWHCCVHTDVMADVSWLLSTSVEKSYIVPERTVLVFLKYLAI